ncbi:MAG: DUF885 domain-containing protein [Planctomycetota bacterium]
MKQLFAVVIACVVSWCACAQLAADEAERVLDQYLLTEYMRSPVWLEKYVDQKIMAGRLPSEAPRAYADYYRRQQQILERIERMDLSSLDDDLRLSVELVQYKLDLSLEASALRREQMPVTSIGGPQYWLPQLPRFSKLQTPLDYDEYLSRLGEIPRVLAETEAQMRLGMEAGRVPPRVIIEPAVAQARAQVVARPMLSPFYQPFADRVPSDPQARRAFAVIEEEVVPAYELFAEFLESEYLPACRETVGISEGIDGIAAYEIALREHTTLELSADEVHEIGLAEVARIRSEMMETIRRTDWFETWTDKTGGTSESDDDTMFDAFVTYLRTDPRFYYETEEELLDGYRAISKLIDPEMVKLFRVLPRMPYGVAPIPRFAARFSPTAYYYSGSVEEGRPGYFMANTSSLDQRPTYDMIALTLHEGVPGHHLQNALHDEMDTVHPVRNAISFTAFGEGWGLYAERLGLEIGDDPEFGLYADPYDDFGRLNFEIWRAIRLVVDSGLHAKGWSRDEAIGYMRANSGATETNIRNEIDRYIGWPGQATAYKIGELKIRELRAHAESALGDAFDVRDFHDELMSLGSVPLPVLESHMRRWVTDRR